MRKQILVGIDGSAAGVCAADWAAARTRDLGLRLNIVHAVPEPWAFPEKADHAAATAQAKDLLSGEAARLASRMPSLDIVTTLSSGEPAETMRRLSAGAEMIVVGTDRRPDNHSEGFGSVSFQIALISHCAVVVVPVSSAQESSGVVVGIDGSQDSALALELAANEARRMGQELVVVHAIGSGSAPVSSENPVRGAEVAAPEFGGHALLSASVQSLATRYPDLLVREILDRRRSPAEALLDPSAHARLLVIGCKGRGGARVLVGSVAQHVLLNVQSPTLVTRSALNLGQAYGPKHPN